MTIAALPDLSARATLTRDRIVRQAHPIETRETTDGELVLSGYASIFNEGYEVWDWLGPFTEVVEAGAFTKTLAEKDDVRLLLNHDGLPLARTKSGTLSLSQDDTGLKVEARLDSADPDVAALVPKMRRGDLDEMSFAFQILQQQWSPDWVERHIKEVKLFDVSVVTYPANPATSAWLNAQQFAADLGRGELLLAGARTAGTEPGPVLDAIIDRLAALVAATRTGPAAAVPAAGGMSLGTAKAISDLLCLSNA